MSGQRGAPNAFAAAVFFDLNKKKDKLHLLLGLRKILLDIDKAIKIIRETEEDASVIPSNPMEGFGIDKIQAEFIADIRLRNINKEYILKRTQETEALENEIKKLEEIVKSKAKIRNIIIKELEQIYGEEVPVRAPHAHHHCGQRAAVRRGGPHRGLSGAAVPYPRGLLQEDYAAVVAYVAGP